MTRKSRPLRILHLHANLGDHPAEFVALLNASGRACEHIVVSATAEASNALHGVDRGVAVATVPDFPALQGRPTPRRLQRLAQAMLGHDLVLTYDYGAMDAVMAHTVFGGRMPVPPLVHHDSGDTARTLTNDWYRRIGLGRAAALIVPSLRVEAIAVDKWHQPGWRVKCIPHGIRTSAYAVKPRRDALPRIIKRDGELWLGTFAGSQSVDEWARLMRAFAALPEQWQLVILGECPQRDAIRDEALRLDLAHRVHLPGIVAEPAKILGLFDLIALLPGRQQFPHAVIEAMAAALAVVATDVDDPAALLAPENRPFITAAADAAGFAMALQALATAPALRDKVGSANRALARAKYDEATMLRAYRSVYAAALGHDTFP